MPPPRFLALCFLFLTTALVQAIPPGNAPGASYNGVYQGGYPYSPNGADGGVYIGGYSGGYHQGYTGVYEGGPPRMFEQTPLFYNSVLARSAQEHGFAVIDLYVPKPAQVWVENRKLAQDAGWKRYFSPALNANEKYTYHIRAQWSEKGRPVEAARKFPVYAGEHIKIDLAAPAEKKPVSPGKKAVPDGSAKNQG